MDIVARKTISCNLKNASSAIGYYSYTNRYKFIENIVIDIFVLIRRIIAFSQVLEFVVLAGGSSFTRKDLWESVTFITCSR